MPICAPRACGCQFSSETLTIQNVDGVVTIEIASDSIITEIQDDIADIQTEQTNRQPTSYAAAGTGGTTSGTTVLTLATISFPAQPVGGVLNLWGAAVVTAHTVTSDTFDLRIVDSVAGTLGAARYTTSSVTSEAQSMNAQGRLAITAGVAYTITLAIVRNTGTGTATVATSTPHTRIDGIFIPAAP